MLCLGDCPKTIKSLPYNHLGINNFEFLKYFFFIDYINEIDILFVSLS